jgi:ABC-type glycerol-3-phosphate transport system substrate-binding protein
MEGLTRVIEAFHGLNPGVEFVLSYFPTQDLRSAFEAAAAQGTGPSILFGPDVWGPVLWREGWVQDVADLLAPGVRAAVLPFALAQVTYGEVVLGVPLETQGVVLYVNRDLLPEPADTVTELLVPGGGPDGGPIRGSPDLGLNFAGSQLAACEATLVTPGGEPAFAGAPGLCWLNLLKTIGLGSAPTYNTDDDLGLFEIGQASWIMDGTWNMERLLGSVGGETLAIDPWPVYEGTGSRLAGYVWTENAYLAANLAPEDLEASWEFIRYLISPEVQSILAEPGGARHLPAAAGVWVSDPLLSQAMAALSQGVPFPINLETAVYAEPVERAIWLVVRQGADPGAALQRALDEVQVALVHFRSGQ